MSYFRDSLNYIQKQSLKEDNCIPFGFDRFSDDLEGILQGTYTIITASSGIGKSKYTIVHYIIKVIDFIINNPNSPIDVRIPFFSLEESTRKIILAIQCHLLYRRYNIRLSIKDLQSTKKNKRVVDKELLDKLESLDDWFKIFEQKVEIIEYIRNPYGIYKHTKELCDSLGTIKEEIQIKEGVEKKVKVYTSNNPDMYIIPIVDNINLLQREKEQPTSWDTINKHSADYCIHLRNFYNCSPVDIQQQAAEKEKQEFYKGQTIESKLEPSLDGLGDNKTTQRNADIVIGLFAPDRYELRNHDGYSIGKLGDCYRSLKILKHRDGESNVKIGLFFDGANLNFEELPRKEEFEIEFGLYDRILNKYKIKEIRELKEKQQELKL